MKKYLLGLFAVVLAVGFSAFTSIKTASPTTDVIYYVYNTGPQDDAGSYTPLEDPSSAPERCPDETTICWIKVDLTQSETFQSRFAQLDQNPDGVIDALDNLTEDHATFELKD